jgi:CRP/FNR family cyclic AMP-dependent transcriptional regulator
MGDERIDLLHNTSIFAAMTPRALELLLERAGRREVAKGEYFFREGDEGHSIYVLERGRVSILKRWQEEEYVIRTLVAGDFFGEIAVLDLLPRSASVVAEEDCVSVEFRAIDVLAVARHDLEQFTMIYMNIARELGRRLRQANELLFEAKIRYESVPEAFAFTI